MAILNKYKWQTLAGNIFISIISFLIFAPQYSLLHFINALFYVSFVYFFVWIIGVVIRGGFFDGIVFGFRRFAARSSWKKENYDEWKEKPRPSETISKSFLRFLLFQFVILFSLMFVLLFLYYQ